MTDGEGYEDHGSKAAAALIQDVQMPDAIFAVNDSVAIGALQRIKSAGLRTPQDIAIVGFSNEKTSRFVDPPLTTVDQPSKEMGRKAAEILIEAIEGKSTEVRTVLIPTHLVIRAST
jgi:DNA-binding LacI/PurR family transcriptional regulator